MTHHCTIGLVVIAAVAGILTAVCRHIMLLNDHIDRLEALIKEPQGEKEASDAKA